MNESDLRSDVHYLGSSENKAWKKFRPVRDLNESHIFELRIKTLMKVILAVMCTT